jgi:hypothetical protein
MGGAIRLGGVAYPLVAGAYTRFDATGGPQVRTGRVAVSAFGGGQRQALPADPARSWDGIGVRAVYGGGGVEPWPHEEARADANLLDLPGVAQTAHAAAVGGAVYVGIGRRLYKTVAMGAGAWANLAVVADFGAGNDVTCVTPTVNDDLIVGLGAGTDARLFDTGANGHVAWRAGERVVTGIGYGAQVIYAPKAAGAAGGNRERLKISLTRFNGALTSDERFLDANIVRMAMWGGKAAIVTRRSLFLFGGQPEPGRADDPNTAGDQGVATAWRGDPEPVFSHGAYTGLDDFVFLAPFQGRLWTWLGGRVQSWDGSAAGWRQHPVEGVTCYGACVAGGHLVVALATAAGVGEVWAFDGFGWWRTVASAAGSPARVWPVALYGAGGRDLLVFTAGTAGYDLCRTEPRGGTARAYRSSGEWVSSLLDAGERATLKGWVRIGASFAAPEGRGSAGSTDPVTLRLWWSADGGANWTAAAEQTLPTAGARVSDLAAELAGVSARFLQLKVQWLSVADWAPVLTGVWAEWAVLEVPPPKRRWEVTVRCSDLATDGDGRPWPAPGAAIAAALWAAWEGGAALAFRDVDFTADPTERTVRIGHVAETAERAGDGARWGETRVRLLLVEQ